MRKNPIFSVCVPVYNVEKTLKRCMDSIFAQTFNDYEILLIDDGSTDGSGALCDEYAKQYNNIRVFHKQNEGLGPTRNLGIKEAKGDYIYHCDSDDWLKEDLLEKTYRKAIETDAEVVIFGYEMFTENAQEFVHYRSVKPKEENYNSHSEIRGLFVENYFTSFVMMSACTRIYKREFLINNDLYFPPLRRCQDMAYSLLLFDKLQKLSVLSDDLYCYAIVPGTYKGRSFEEMLYLYSTIKKLVSEKFDNWSLLSDEIKQKVNNYYCEQVANYSAYAIAVKYSDRWKENTKILSNDMEIRKAFKNYVNVKKSKFMMIFRLAIQIKSKVLLKLISKYSQKKIKF